MLSAAIVFFGALVCQEFQTPTERGSDPEIEVVLDEKNGAEHNEDSGKLKWELQIPNGETKKVIYKYTVKYPKNKSIGNL